MPEPAIDPQYLSLLRRFDTPTVCNVIELFDVRPRNEGFMDRSISSCFPRQPPVVGYATTATFRSARPAPEGDVYASLADQVERILADVPAPRIVVFQDLDEPPAAATFGEVMCTVYKAFGCVGLVTSGAARDLEQVERLGFPCFASSTIASHGYSRILDVNVEVQVGGVAIRPGDVLHADANGVTTIPRDLVPEVALACQRFMDAEALVLDYARAGDPAVDGLRRAHEACARRFAQIPDEVRRELKR
jgi:regulator of RNase E activity RraA